MIYDVVHLTTVHSRGDTRIFVKQCSSLAKYYKLALLVADGLGNENKNNIDIIDIGKYSGRFNRLYKGAKDIYERALMLDASVYHIHDPELIPIGVKLEKSGKKVIFDAHEDFPKQVLTKPYLPMFLKRIVGFFAIFGEKIYCSKLSGIIGATPYITTKFSRINNNVININNFPRIDELQTINNPRRKIGTVCYIGGISVERGILEILEALLLTKNKARLALAGKFYDAQLGVDIKKLIGWDRTEFLGFVGRKEITELLSTVQVGMVTLHPTPNYLDSLPVKLFEYMCAGIPVIASDFPLWQDIVIKNKCGLCVDPKSPQEIADAIDYLIENPTIADEMGRNGFRAIQNEFNWAIEEQKLLKFYESILNEDKTN
ncbi:glycosyltransferase [Acinetobacter suaedae]|uniref:glycosyltransferase n=1 Tax=Acinetobacter suaedae TaxID=2609668 RepID=UPI00148F17EE|nr:glycosyltransferase [Acinetobacter sp. C16S1]